MNSPLVWTSALPQGFDFYHLGRIDLIDREDTARVAEAASETFEIASDDRIAISYSIEGEVRGVLVLLLDGSLDTSTYSEAGNIIASRLATNLYESHGLDVTISPPRIHGLAQLKGILNHGPAQTRSYIHRHGSSAIQLQAVIVPAATPFSEAIANA